MEPILSAFDRKRIRQMRIMNFLLGASGATIGFNVLFLQTKGMEAGAVGIVMGINAIIGALSPPVWGLFADKIQSKYRIFVYAVVGSCVVSVLIPLSAAIKIGSVMLATAFIPLMNFFRMPSQTILDASSVSASAVVPGMDYSDVRLWMSIGFTVMSIGYSPLINLLGASFPFYAFLLFSIGVLTNRKTLKQYDDSNADRQSIPIKDLQLSRLFKDYYLIVFLLINILIQIPQNCMMMMSYLLADIGSNISMVGIITGARVSAEVTVLLLSFRIKRVLSKPMMMVMAALFFLAEMLSYQIVHSFLSAALSTMFGGIAFGLILSTGFNYVNDLAPKGLEATAISLYSIGNPIAGVLTSFLGGQIIATQGVRMLYLYSAGCAVLWLVIFFCSYFVGEKILKKKAPLPLFRRI